MVLWLYLWCHCVAMPSLKAKSSLSMKLQWLLFQPCVLTGYSIGILLQYLLLHCCSGGEVPHCDVYIVHSMRPHSCWYCSEFVICSVPGENLTCCSLVGIVTWWYILLFCCSVVVEVHSIDILLFWWYWSSIEYWKRWSRWRIDDWWWLLTIVIEVCLPFHSIWCLRVCSGGTILLQWRSPWEKFLWRICSLWEPFWYLHFEPFLHSRLVWWWYPFCRGVSHSYNCWLVTDRWLFWHATLLCSKWPSDVDLLLTHYSMMTVMTKQWSWYYSTMKATCGQWWSWNVCLE